MEHTFILRYILDVTLIINGIVGLPTFHFIYNLFTIFLTYTNFIISKLSVFFYINPSYFLQCVFSYNG